jgi:hypothetical protein
VAGGDSVMRIRSLLVVVAILVPLAVVAQKKPEKAKVHADFYFGSLPLWRDAADLLTKEKYREVLVAYHMGWDDERIIKELKFSESELADIYADLDDQRLAVQPSADSDTVMPNLPVIRERDIERVQDSLQRSTHDFAAQIRTNLPAIEAMVAAIPNTGNLSKGQLRYQTIVSDILLGGLVDALYDDKTLLPPGRRRAKQQRFHGWLVESDPKMAGRLKRESRESEEFEIVSIGTELSKQRPSLASLRSSGATVIDSGARSYRMAINVLCRDKLLPFLKSHRNDYLRPIGQIEAGKYSAAGEIFAWYYVLMVNGVADEFAAAKLIDLPKDQYSYAVKTSR